MSITTLEEPRKISAHPIPPLVAGEQLSLKEFRRRYEAMPSVKKAELIEGVVYMPSPVRTDQHGAPNFLIVAWLAHYSAVTPGLQGTTNATIWLDLNNAPQPDAFLRILPASGGQTTTEDGYTTGPPELVAEVSASTTRHDLNEKFNAFQRNGVREYIIWRVEDQELDWFVLRETGFERLPPNQHGIAESKVFPGLRLDINAILRNDLERVLEVVKEGTKSSAHAEFVNELKRNSHST